MRLRLARRGGLVAVAAIAALIAGVAPASASPGDASSFAVKVDVKALNAQVLSAGPFAAASTPSPAESHLVSAEVPGVLKAGVLNAYASKDENSGEVSSNASTAELKVALLKDVVGIISADLVKAECAATQAGEVGKTTLVGLKAGKLADVAVAPSANTKIEIALPGVVGNVATIIFNEQVKNKDGSLTVNAIHIKLLGDTLQLPLDLKLPVDLKTTPLASGDVIISSATCGPADLPVPMASGAGLYIGLGLLGLVAIPVAVIFIRKRRTSAVAAA
jgi:hypothetical protein